VIEELRHGASLAGLVREQLRAEILHAGLAEGWFRALQSARTGAEFARSQGLDAELAAAWLRAAAAHGLLVETSGRYAVSPFTRWCLDSREADAAVAMLDQAREGYRPLLASLPALMRGGERPSWGSEEEARRTARASRIFESFGLRALRRVPGASRARRFLDVGCGEASLLIALLTRHRDAVGDGVELHAAVAEQAREAARAAGVHRRCEIHTGDFLELSLPAERFDLVTLNDDLHYFDEPTRVRLFQRVHERLGEGGLLAIRTPVISQGWLARRSGVFATLATFDLFLRAHRNLHPLPEPAELNQQLRTVGYTTVGRVRSMPGSSVVWARKGKRRRR
jgi:SAM-dependent methyltransferase